MLPYDKPTVNIAPNGMEASIVLVPVAKEPPGSGFWVPSMAELEMILKEAGVKTPMDSVSLRAALERLSEGLKVEAVASRARPPETGQDGWLEILVDLGGPQSPSQEQGGSVDLKSSNIIRSVKAGQPLAMIHAPRMGRDGMDVRGKALPSRIGREYQPNLSPRIKRAEKDPNLLVAATDGHVRIQDGWLDVEECFQVSGDVDYASGNVGFAKSVLVEGDVKAGFSVEAGGDVEIQGIVEDCQVRAQGRVFIRGGFTGSGKGMLEAKGDVGLAHLRNQTVRCEGDLSITKEAVNGRIQCRGRVNVNGLLAGGRTQAFRSISCQLAGTETGTPTMLEAGFDYTVSEEIAAIRKEMGDMGRYAKKLDVGLKHLQNLDRLHRGLEPGSVGRLFEMERMKAKVEAKIVQLRERYSELEGRGCDVQGAVVVIRKRAYPGTVIKIGEDVFRVEAVLEGPKSFRVRQGLIEMHSEGASAP